jgi:hypothetical protein
MDAPLAETGDGPADQAGRMGVRRVTVSTPFLLELVKRRFPEFKVRVGIYAQVDTPRRARFWEELGADAIVLESFSINRNFRRLAAIRQAVRCDLQLIANHVCLMNCPMQTYHQNGFAHASDDTGTLFIDYCFLRCSRLRLTDPSQFIKSAWIRPEDLAVYEAMGYTTSSFWNGGFRRRNCCGASKPTASGGSMAIWPNCCCRMASSNRSARNRSGVCVTSGSRGRRIPATETAA